MISLLNEIWSFEMEKGQRRADRTIIVLYVMRLRGRSMHHNTQLSICDSALSPTPLDCRCIRSISSIDAYVIDAYVSDAYVIDAYVIRHDCADLALHFKILFWKLHKSSFKLLWCASADSRLVGDTVYSLKTASAVEKQTAMRQHCEWCGKCGWNLLAGIRTSKSTLITWHRHSAHYHLSFYALRWKQLCFACVSL